MIVVDASVVYKWLVDETLPTTQTARNLLTQFLRGEEHCIAPNLLLYELGNIFACKARLPLLIIHKIWKHFQRFALPLYIPDGEFIDRCIDFSKRYSVSIYDAAYAVLAKDKKGVLITADAKFVRSIDLPYVQLLS